jgi:hypothetical protein
MIRPIDIVVYLSTSLHDNPFFRMATTCDAASRPVPALAYKRSRMVNLFMAALLMTQIAEETWKVWRVIIQK